MNGTVKEYGQELKKIKNMANIITKTEYENLKKELERLKGEEVPKVAHDLKEAIAQGDLSENAAYSDAKDRQAELQTKIAAIEAKLAMAEIIEEVEAGEVIHVGKNFKVLDMETSQERQFTIVGSQEAAPQEGKISFDSPLGSAFMEKKQGDEVDVLTPGGKRKYKITEIL